MAKGRQAEPAAYNVNCFSCQSRERSEWCALSRDELTLLNDSKQVLSFSQGETVFAQGTPASGVYCVEEGSVAVRRSDAQGNEILLRMAHPGDTLGYRDFFGDGEHAASAQTLTPARVCMVEGRSVRRMLRDNPNLGLGFLAHMARDLALAEQSLLHNSALTVRTRLVHLLLTLKDRFADVEEDGTLVLSLPLARQDLAALLGTRPETIARTINALEGDHVAQFSGRKVSIPDLDVLLDEIEPYN